jgi:hypothetical protein
MLITNALAVGFICYIDFPVTPPVTKKSLLETATTDEYSAKLSINFY